MLGMRKNRQERVTDMLKEAVSYTEDILRDERLLSDVRSAVGHGARATQRVRDDLGLSGVAGRLAADRELRKDLRSLLEDLDSVSERARRKRGHRVRNTLLVIGGTGATLAAMPKIRRWLANHVPRSSHGGAQSVATV